MGLTEAACADLWAGCGAMALTGRLGQPPLGPPARLVPRLQQLGRELQAYAERGGGTFELEPLNLLAERAALLGLARHGDVSCGNATRLLRTLDGWLAVSLAREEDREAVPAWLGWAARPLPSAGRTDGALWDEVATSVGAQRVAHLAAQARLLGLPAGPLPPAGHASADVSPWRARPVSRSGRSGREKRSTTRSWSDLVVVDLSSLWAGPLCAHLLTQLGMRVVKVESSQRPDGARRSPAFFDLLHAGQQSVVLDLTSRRDVDGLRSLLQRADIVIEASRPRALEQLGIVAEHLLDEGPAVWTSITGYGRSRPERDWVAFGDDAAVAGGLVVWDEEGPCFCADAIADPLSGVAAAVATLAALTSGRPALIDVSMARVAAWFGGATLRRPATTTASVPRAREAGGRAAALGADSDDVLRWLGRATRAGRSLASVRE